MDSDRRDIPARQVLLKAAPDARQAKVREAVLSAVSMVLAALEAAMPANVRREFWMLVRRACLKVAAAIDQSYNTVRAKPE